MTAYNEQGVIEKVIKEYYYEIFMKLTMGSEFIIYLDKPTDNTVDLVKGLKKELDIKIIEGEKNLGYAGALKHALKEAKNEVIFYSDTSGKHRASDFWSLISLINNFDIVTGLRKPRHDPILRQFISAIQNAIVSSLFTMPFYDYNTGYKVVKKNVLNDVLDECKYMKQSFSSELLIRAYYKKYKVTQRPVEFNDRKTDKSTATNFKKLPSIIKQSLIGYAKLFFELRREFIVYSIIGALATTIDWGLFYLFIFILHTDSYIAIFFSFLSGATSKFLLNKSLTFKNKSKEYFKQIGKFIFVNIVALLGSIVIFYVFLNIFSFNKMVARMIVTLIILFINYNLDKKLTYN